MIASENNFDVVIIGGGPAGLSAAIWAAELGLRAVIVEREDEFGGQLTRIYNKIGNYLGLGAENGVELRDLFVKHAASFNFDRSMSSEVLSVDLFEKKISLADGTEFQGRSIIIATGVRRRELHVPGETEFRGRGIMSSGVGEKDAAAGRRVVIVGGGDAALENAMLLSGTAEKVFIVHRRDEFAARSEFQAKAKAAENVELITPAIVISIIGNASVDAVTVRDLATGRETLLSADRVLIRIGVDPNTELFSEQIELDAAGYIVADSTCRTSLPDVFAIGDVANPRSPTIATAVGNGATAAKVIAALIENEI